MDYTIRIGGEAGQGLQTVGASLAKGFSRQGYHVFTHQDYMSRIRGGHNYYQIRISENPLCASREVIDILVALDRNTIDIHHRSLSESGVILYDPEEAKEEWQEEEFLAVPFTRIAVEEGGNKIMANSVAVGSVVGLFNLDLEVIAQFIGASLKKKSEAIIKGNLKAARAGHQYVRERFTREDRFRTAEPQPEKLMLINGIQAIAAGALLSGCKFYSAYPMTPSTGIMVYLAGKAAEFDVVVEQAEDEISAINMAIGASYAGVRAMTGTSGGGFALMTEGISLAGMTETPIVVAEMQRPGPATGLPTRTEQGDLFFVIYGGHGEFPKVVLTPGTPEQAFYAANKAFELAEKYQVPVFIQGDQYLGDAEWTFTGFDLNRLSYRDYRLRKKALREVKGYKRYAFTDNGISPLAVPGDSKHLVVVDSDEHDEEGHIIEDGETRARMVEKRWYNKLKGLQKEISPPTLYGEQEPAMVIVGYGSTFGVMKEAVDVLVSDFSIAMLHFSEVYPFPLAEELDYLRILRYADQTVCVEANASGQFKRLFRAETGFQCSLQVNRYDGRPFTLDSLVGQLREKLRET